MSNILQYINVEDINVGALFISILVLLVVRNVGDWFIYNLKTVPKEAQVSKIGWFIGWTSLLILLYLYCNMSNYSM